MASQFHTNRGNNDGHSNDKLQEISSDPRPNTSGPSNSGPRANLTDITSAEGWPGLGSKGNATNSRDGKKYRPSLPAYRPPADDTPSDEDTDEKASQPSTPGLMAEKQQKRVELIREVFHLVDVNKSGCLTPSELIDLLGKRTYYVERIMEQWDQDMNKKIDVEEFARGYQLNEDRHGINVDKSIQMLEETIAAYHALMEHDPVASRIKTPYDYTPMQPEDLEEAKFDDAPVVTNASAEDPEGNPVGVQAKFTSLANAFQQIPQLITDLASAFNTKMQGMVDSVNAAFTSMNTNVNSAVDQVQTDAHGKRGEIITHVNAEGAKAETAINALQSAQQDLIQARAAAALAAEAANAEAQNAQTEKDGIVTQRLEEHNETIAGHTGQLEGHLARLDDHTDKLATQRHQLDLAKAAMDKDLHGGYGNRHQKGTSADMLRDWDEANPRKTKSQEAAENNSQGSSPRSQTSGRSSNGRSRSTSPRSAEGASGRRRLASDSHRKSHTVVLETLLEEINRQN